MKHLKNRRLRDDFCVQSWVTYAAEDDEDCTEFNALIVQICKIDKQLAMSLEAAANNRVAEAAVKGFLLGWETREDPDRLLFED